MKVHLDERHRVLLATIVSEAQKLLDRGTADTGPGGENAERLAVSLREMTDSLDYYLGES